MHDTSDARIMLLVYFILGRHCIVVGSLLKQVTPHSHACRTLHLQKLHGAKVVVYIISGQRPFRYTVVCVGLALTFAGSCRIQSLCKRFFLFEVLSFKDVAQVNIETILVWFDRDTTCSMRYTTGCGFLDELKLLSN